MTKSSIICKSCNADNVAESEFCIECGTNLIKPNKISEDENLINEYRSWKRSVPYTISAAVFITFIDLFTSGGVLRWSFWASVPIILFAVIAPYFSYKFGR